MDEEVLTTEPTEEVAETETLEDADDLFSDLTFDDEGNLTEDMPTKEETPAEEAKTEEPFLSIKYDKQDVGLTREEAIDLAEKGKNYERLRDKYNTLNDRLSALSSRNGMSNDDFLKSLEEVQMEHEINLELNEIKKAYPDADPNLLKELARNRAEAKRMQVVQTAQKEQQEQADAQTLEIKRQLNLFRQEYPNLEPDKLDKKVYDYVKNGYTLLEAYSKWARTEGAKSKPADDTKAKISQINEENKKRSLGNISNTGDVEGENDFFKAFNSAF